MSSPIVISVILPTYNRLNRLKQVLSGLAAQDLPMEQFEVIVVSDGSTDGTNEFLQTVQMPFRLTPVVQVNQGPAAARNTGLSYATGEYIVFLDDDVYPMPSLLSEHLRAHRQESQPVAVIGPMLTPPGYHPTYWVRWSHTRLNDQYQAMLNNAWKPIARQFYTGNASFPRTLYLQYGGFDPAFRRAEDVELAYRYECEGVQFRFNPNAVGYHYEERSFPSWARIGYDYGRCDIVFSLQKKHTWLLPTIRAEFRRRNWWMGRLILLSLDHKWLSASLCYLAKHTASLGDRWNKTLLTRVGCSLIFNLNYYQGTADELGGKKNFVSLLRQNPEKFDTPAR